LHKVIAMRKGLKGEIDHHDQNSLNNKRNNLRPCTRSQNLANGRRQSNNTSGFRGVSWHEGGGKWRAYITVNGKRKHLGLYCYKTTAARAYNKAAVKYFGEFAVLNKI